MPSLSTLAVLVTLGASIDEIPEEAQKDGHDQDDGKYDKS
jgi:hypothetical protein